MLLLFLLFIFPVAIYCLILGVLNRRDRPLLVSGAWDFAGVVFAASGFLIFVGPAVLSTLHERWRYYWLLSESVPADEAGGISYYLWLAVWYLYYAVVVGGAAYMLYRRKRQTAIYNVEITALEVALARVFDRLGLAWTRAGNYLYLKPGDTASKAERLPASVGSAAVLEIESFPAFCHATLRWHEMEETLRQEIERDLGKVLDGMPSHQNPSAGWFLSLASLLLFATLLGILFIVLVNLRVIR